jgi:hypothetical protein
MVLMAVLKDVFSMVIIVLTGWGANKMVVGL